MRSTLPTLFLLSVIWAAPVWANQANRLVEILVPDAGVIQRLTVTDGSQLYGQVESIEIDSVVFRSVTGLLLTVPRDEIADLRIVRGHLVGGEFLPQDSHNTRLMFAPTARSLRRGEGYFGVYYVLPFVQVGVTDRLSIGGGTPLVFGDGARPVWFTPKLQVLARENVQAALGVIHITGVDDLNAGIAYGVATLGPEDKAATIGLGYAYSGGQSVGHLDGRRRAPPEPADQVDHGKLVLGPRTRLRQRRRTIPRRSAHRGSVPRRAAGRRNDRAPGG